MLSTHTLFEHILLRLDELDAEVKGIQTAMSLTSDAIAAQTTAIQALTAAVANIPNDSADDAANAAAIEANTDAITVATTTLTGDVTEAALSVPAQTIDATVGTAVSVQLSADGGTPPYTWTGTTLSSGLVLDANGLVSGTPATSGTFTDTVTVTDSESTPATASGTLTTTVS